MTKTKKAPPTATTSALSPEHQKLFDKLLAKWCKQFKVDKAKVLGRRGGNAVCEARSRLVRELHDEHDWKFDDIGVCLGRRGTSTYYSYISQS